jgi:2-oxoglutarate ferredoxin oxidoreductase subunit delta
MSKPTINRESCKACHYCIAACPQEAISVSGYTNKKGHRVVAIDREKCILCGACFIVCPDYVFEFSGEAQ